MDLLHMSGSLVEEQMLTVFGSWTFMVVESEDLVGLVPMGLMRLMKPCVVMKRWMTAALRV